MQERLWVFAYASLIWQPGFQPEKSLKARINGYHRSLCVLSVLYRGTPDNPGLVMGLDRGGSCLGVVHLVGLGEEEAVRAKLDARELPTGVYDPLFLQARTETGDSVLALAYVAKRDHEQYRRLDEAKTARLVREGLGKSGRAFDYLRETLDSLEKLGIRDGKLKKILELAR